MDDKAKKILLDIARKSVEAAIKRDGIPPILCSHSELQGKQGAFVTLKIRGHLRGCIGRFTSDVPLYRLVSEIAISSAMEDPRFEFNRIKPMELNLLEIEISVLSPLRPLHNPLDFELGKHGIYLRRGNSIGCFLPQVATETGWSKEEFLSQCCWSKAGIPDDAWKSSDVEIYTFTAEIIEDKNLHIS